MADAERQARPTDDSEMVELREEFTYALTEKREIRDEGAEDMRYIAGKCFDDDDRTAREEANRPIVEPDELNQYVNQLINSVRQNKRSIRVAPVGAKANPKTAEFRQNLIRQIEYRSNAPQVYAVMFENTAQRSYGYLRVVPDYVNHDSFDQELRIKAVQNPDLVTEDPADGRTDGSDWQYLYYAESWTWSAVKRRFPGAKRYSFQELAGMKGVSDWTQGPDRILLAERWRIVPKKRTLLLVQPPAPQSTNALMAASVVPMPFTQFEDELQDRPLPPGARVLKDRRVDYPTVKKQITNGLEILEEVDFPGTSIPFVACYGKVLYMPVDGLPKKIILSLIRLGRSPQMLYAYYRTQQAEMAGMIPKTPVAGYKGQFDGVENDWQRAPHEPLAFLESNFTAEGWNPSWGPMPLPQRIAYDAGAHLQALELCAEGARRAIQAAIGVSPLPTQAQRRNEKSGVALQQIEDAEQRGSFHFIDHFDDALTRTGAILDELIPHYYDAARDVTVRNAEDQPEQIRINDPNHPESVSAVEGDHDVTISVGPRESSEREAASNFADLIVGSALIKLLPPPLALKVVSMAVRLKAVGPIGDEIADLLSPKEGEQQGPTPEQVGQMQAQIQQLTGQLQEAARKLETEEAQQRAKVEIAHIQAQMQVELQKMKDATSIAVAEINARAKGVLSANEGAMEAAALAQEQAHDAQQAEMDRQHEAAMSVMGAQHAATAADQGHQQALEQGDASAANAMAQQANQAALQPPAAE